MEDIQRMQDIIASQKAIIERYEIMVERNSEVHTIIIGIIILLIVAMICYMLIQRAKYKHLGSSQDYKEYLEWKKHKNDNQQ